ncbi:MAG: bifunctional homocysteine S-methyltransferase/methylenetetrahydrofolate reductase [bacterium]|nr:bifunctional homocysteine S-methyltransferase/methylenetetrahydrofolate reductase [bacterium]
MDFLSLLNERIIVADGAMGTMLYAMGVPKGHCYDELNLSKPKLVKEIHQAYIDAGADLIETNTFGANSYILGKYYDLDKKTADINYMGAKIARKVCRDKLVAGAVGPITRPIEAAERLSLSEIHSIFKEQITALANGGVDLIILETMSSIDELIQGFLAASEVCNLPVICQLSFVHDCKTILGIDPVEAANALEKAGAHIMGANCGTGPQVVYEAVRRMGHVTDAFISALPNAGLASFSQGKFVYPATPEYFAAYSKKYVDAGVSIIGGCCGSTPTHIAAISNVVKGMRPKPRKIVRVEVKTECRGLINQTHISEVTSPLQQKLKEKFILSLEIDPPRCIDFDKELNAAQNFKAMGGECVNVSDTPMARLRMSPISLAHIIKHRVDIDVILHCTCRDRNLIAIQSDLIGAYSLGIRNILALTGDPPSVGDYPFAAAVFEITSDKLIEIINSLNRGVDWLGNPIGKPTSFFIGVAGKLNEPERVKEKAMKGIGFIQTQPVFDIKEIQSFVKEVAELHIPVITGILPLVSVRHAEFIQNEVPGITIPDKVMKRMRDGAADEGVKIAHELFDEIKLICNGVCIMPPFGKYELVEKIIT